MNTEALALTPDKMELIRRTLAPDLTNDELALFGEVSRRVGLDPIRRQIYAVKRGGRVTFQTSIDGFRVIAERSGKYSGQLPAQWCGPDGVWVDIWLQPKPPAAARVAVIRSDFAEPVWAVARWDSYAQDQGMWKKMPEHMLAKCAEALAIRKAFPDEIAGLYTGDEMAQAEPVRPRGRQVSPPAPSEIQGAGTAPPASTLPAASSLAPSAAPPPNGNGETGNMDELYALGKKLDPPQNPLQIDDLVRRKGYQVIKDRLERARSAS